MLIANRVIEIFDACIWDGEDGIPIPADGIVTHGVKFDSEKLKEYKSEIDVLLRELPKEFMKSGGGGWSFLNACVTKDGNQWGEHIDMERLLMLGMSVDSVTCLTPDPAIWQILPGGMPYYQVNF